MLNEKLIFTKRKGSCYKLRNYKACPIYLYKLQCTAFTDICSQCILVVWWMVINFFLLIPHRQDLWENWNYSWFDHIAKGNATIYQSLMCSWPPFSAFVINSNRVNRWTAENEKTSSDLLQNWKVTLFLIRVELFIIYSL